MSNTISATRRAAKIFNQDIPCDVLAMPFDIALVSGGTTQVDLTIPTTNGIIPTIQTIFVDNSASSGTLTIQASQTNQVLQVPPLSQAYLPILAPNPPLLTFGAIGGAIAAHIQLMNVPMPIGVWNTVSPASGSTSVTLISRSLVTAAAASSPLMAANANRQYVLIKAPELADLWINPIGGVAAVDGIDCVKILKSGFIYESGFKVWNSAITYFCVTGALNLSAFEG